MDLQAAMKLSIQNYFDGRDPLPAGRKYTKQYLDNFHKSVTTPQDAKKSNKKVAKALAKTDASNMPDMPDNNASAAGGTP